LGSIFALRLLFHAIHAFADRSFKFKSIRFLTGRPSRLDHRQEILEQNNVGADQYVGSHCCHRGFDKLIKSQILDFVSTMSYQGCFIFFIPWAILGIYTVSVTLSSRCWQEKLIRMLEHNTDDRDVTHLTIVLTETVLAAVGIALTFFVFVLNRMDCCDITQDDIEMNNGENDIDNPYLRDLSETTDTSNNSDDVSESLTATDSSISLEAQSQSQPE